MDAMNLVIHIFAMISFFILIWIILKITASEKFTQRCFKIAYQGEKGFMLMPVSRFIERLGHTANFDVLIENINSDVKLIKCEPRPWLEFIVRHGIEKVTLRQSSDKIEAIIRTLNEHDSENSWPEKLASSVDNQICPRIGRRGD